MKKIIYIFLILISLENFSQEYYVTAKSGLNIRERDDSDSKKLGKFNYLDIVKVIKKTTTSLQITKTRTKEVEFGYWYKIKYRGKDAYIWSAYLEEKDEIHYKKATFLNYNDDYDYSLIIATDKKDTLDYINYDEKRNIKKGEEVFISYKKGIIRPAGDESLKILRNIVIKIELTNLSKFKRKYTKPLSYINHTSDNSIYNKVNKDVEYYLANNNDKKTLLAIKNNEDITYRLHDVQKEGKKYLMITIYKLSGTDKEILKCLYKDLNKRTFSLYDKPNKEFIKI